MEADFDKILNILKDFKPLRTRNALWLLVNLTNRRLAVEEPEVVVFSADIMISDSTDVKTRKKSNLFQLSFQYV